MKMSPYAFCAHRRRLVVLIALSCLVIVGVCVLGSHYDFSRLPRPAFYQPLWNRDSSSVTNYGVKDAEQTSAAGNVSSGARPGTSSGVEDTVMQMYFNKLQEVKVNSSNVPKEICPDVMKMHRPACFVKGCNISFPPSKERLRRLLQTQYSVEQKHRAVIDSMAGQPDYADLVFVTAASASHFVESQGLVRDLHQLVFPQLRKENKFSFHFFYYDLGLEHHQLTQLKKYCNCTVIKFPFQGLPHNFRKLRTCLWKPPVIKAHLRFSSITLWMDACVRFKTSNISYILDHARRLGMFVSRNNFMLPMHVHPAMLTYFKIPQQCQLSSFYEVTGGFVVLKNEVFVQKAILDPWVACAFSPNCLCPSETGGKTDCLNFLACTARADPYFRCHRFDQSALGIILASLFGRETTAFQQADVAWFYYKRSGGFKKYFPDA